MFSLPPINTEPTLKRKIGIQDPNLLPSVLEYHWPPRNKCINLGLLPANQYSHEEKKKKSVLPKYSVKSLKRETICSIGPERHGEIFLSLVSGLISDP